MKMTHDELPILSPLLKAYKTVDGMTPLVLQLCFIFFMLFCSGWYVVSLSFKTAKDSVAGIENMYQGPFMASNFARDALVNFHSANHHKSENNLKSYNKFVDEIFSSLDVVIEKTQVNASKKLISDIKGKIVLWKKHIDDVDTTIHHKLDYQIDNSINQLIEQEFQHGYDFLLQNKDSLVNSQNYIEKIGYSIGVFVLLCIVYAFISIMIPIQRCCKIAQKISLGDFSSSIAPIGGREFRLLFQSFKRMQSELNKTIKKQQAELLMIEHQKQLECTKAIIQEEHQKRQELTDQQNLNEKKHRQELLHQISSQLNVDTQEIIGRVKSSDHDLKRVANSVKVAVDQTNQKLEIGANQASEGIDKIKNSFNNVTSELSTTLGTLSNHLVKTKDSVFQINDVVKKIQNQSNVLESASYNARQIAAVVNDITHHINILSVNASIEAARAGDIGKGFSVVAQEVKLLAMRTADENQRIIEKIENITEISLLFQKIMPEIESSMSEFSENFNKMFEQITEALQQSISNKYGAETVVVNTVNDLKQLFKDLICSSDSLYHTVHEVSQVSLLLGQNTNELSWAIQEFKTKIKD